MANELENVLYMYVGSYTDEQNHEGIRLYAFDRQNGGIQLVDSYADLPDASFLTINQAQTKLYAVSETASYEGLYGGSTAAYEIEPGSGKLTKLNQQPTHGAAPCYVSMDANNRSVYVANYTGGNVTVYPVEADGKLGENSQLLKHEGGLGPVADRQEAPHAHSIVPAPNNRYAISADLGLDQLIIYTIDAETGALEPHGTAALNPGSGPRHFAYSTDNRYVYVAGELDSTVTAMHVDTDAGTLTAFQTLTTLPEGYSGENSCADIHLSGDGRYLYVSNRGHDSIAVFAVDEQHGTLSLVQLQATLGRTPRNFALTPQGDYLLAANQESHSITVFRIDAESGKLEATEQTAAVSRPVCIQFL
ncbi:lactonase family protein [Paenibacillus sp. SYP-B3998]|uniref:Lactonase family protein n=1 Tax=Paenibacillus sp. SYP-B3998 TaxID=2678564 RepID=A0A6G3ZSN9_9BACL|nr:lactonase family protein [Paenibacillus sp. SYP-B3998]NEW04601.1 lactonase family protein [Paenibacillus sp. SYP-B3998]